MGPEAIAAVGLIGTLASTGFSIQQSRAAASRQKKQRDRAEAVELEARRKDELLESRSERLRQRRSSGSGKKTILGGDSSATQPEIGRNVLLGQ